MVALTNHGAPATPDLLGELKAIKNGQLKKQELQWRRVQEVCKGGVKLWGPGGPHPTDIGQGSIGNCWMLSAFAAVARAAPHLIKRLFLSPRDQAGEPCISGDGKYTIQLWDVDNKRWEKIAVDDIVFATQDRNGLAVKTARPNNNAIWPVLLEKAFVKFMSSYRAIEGGWHAAAFACVAGDLARGILSYHTKQGEDTWVVRQEIITARDGKRGGVAPNGLTIRVQQNWLADKARPLSSDAMLQEVRKMLEDDRSTYVMGVTSMLGEGSDTKATRGIVHNHAYSLEGVLYPDQLKVKGLTLLKVHNPWGRTEWEGDWRDDDQKWQQHPHVAKLCGHDGQKRDDGMFWMGKTDFGECFRALSIMRLDKQAGDKNLNKDAGRQAAAAKGSAWPDYKFTVLAADDSSGSQQSAAAKPAGPAAAAPAPPSKAANAAPAAAKPAAFAPAAGAAKPAQLTAQAAQTHPPVKK